MKFSNAIAFIVVNLATSATALALPQTEVIVVTATAAVAEAPTAIVGRQQATQPGGGNGPATQTQVITFTQTAASGDASPVVEKRQDLRSTGFTIEGSSQPTPAAAVDMSRDNQVKRQADESPFTIILTQTALVARETEAAIAARQTSDPVPIGARQVGAPLEARQSGVPRFSARQEETRPLPTVGPVKARQEGGSLTGPIPTAVVARQEGGSDNSMIFTAAAVPTEAAVAI